MQIRSTAKAILLHGGKILLNQCYDEKNGRYYSLPGGGQEPYETLHEAVVRECLEETGYRVRPVRFAALCETICMDAHVREYHASYAHKMYHIFVCELLSEKTRPPVGQDDMQLGTEWVEIAALGSLPLLPKMLGGRIEELIQSPIPVFLGSEHIAFNHG